VRAWNPKSIWIVCAYYGAPLVRCPISPTLRAPKKSLIVYAKYDLTFLPEFSRHVVEQFERLALDHKVVILPCGHYSTGETPYKYMDGWHIASFFRTAFES